MLSWSSTKNRLMDSVVHFVAPSITWWLWKCYHSWCDVLTRASEGLLLRPLSVWFLFRTSGNTDWYGDPPEHGNFWENWFFTGKIDHQGHKNPQTYETTCHLGCGTCQNFFSFTFVTVGATFLKVTLKLLRRMTWFPADLSTWFLTPYCQLNSARGLHNANLLLCL